MPTRRDTQLHPAQRIALPTILIALISMLAAGCDKIQIPAVGEQVAPPPAPTAPVQTAPVPVATPMPTPQVKADPKEVVTAFLKKAKTVGLNDQDLLSLTSAEGAEGLDEVLELQLGGGSVTDEGIARLSKFPKLAKLDLSNSGVTNVGLEVVKDLPELRSLSLTQTKVDDRSMAAIASNPGIKELFLSHTGVTDFGLNELEKLEELEVLDISNTAITGSGFERFKGHKHLRSVIAQRSRLQNEALKYLTNCPIEVLEIDMSGVSDAGMIHVGKMKKLKRLSMGFSPISDVGIHKLGLMKDLESINVHNDAQVSNLLFQKLKSCKKLQHVCVTGTLISPKDCAMLMKLIPGCKVVF